MVMILRNKRGQESKRELEIRTLEVKDDGDKSLTVFHTPRDVRGTALLTYSHGVDPDDQWLYLPALRRVKRIASNNQSGPFMGSEFAYEDLSSQEIDKYTYSGHADNHLKLVALMEVCNAAGLCMFGYLSYPAQSIPDQLSAVTGWEFDLDEVYRAGERIFTMRHAFNVREGINPLARNVPGRLVGEPPLEKGNVRDVTVDYKGMSQEFLQRLGWDTATTVPDEEALRGLGMDFLVEDMSEVKVSPA
jgi:aldehyde:ferredoxin oxidoreductase